MVHIAVFALRNVDIQMVHINANHVILIYVKNALTFIETINAYNVNKI